MRSLLVALAQVNPTVGDLQGNAALVRRWHERAAAAGADVIAFPELTITGYPPEDLLMKPQFVRDNLAALEWVASTLHGPVAIVGFVDRNDGGTVANAAAVIADGAVRGVYHKMLLPNYGVFDEKRYFAPGAQPKLFGVGGVTVAVTVCEDAWEGTGPVSLSAKAGAEVVVNVNASPYHLNKSFERQVLFRQRARDNGVFFCYVQTVGGQDELVFDGDSLVYDPSGKLLARGSQFEEDLVVVDLALPDKPRARARKAAYVEVTGAPAATRAATARATTKERAATARAATARAPLPARKARIASSPDEEIYGALLLGTRDYLRKNGFSSAVIGLSGGIDSSLTAVIASDAIGPENVTGVAMPSVISSNDSLEDAKELATNLGIEFHVVPIAPVVDAFASALADPFAGTAPGLAEENLQARIRGTILMALSNKFGSLVLTTGNKSEMAVGYSTLYGDMAGGFAVLKDVPKTLVYELAAWRNSTGLTAIPERVFTKPPTAELRPGQLDTDSLPPYETLDPIIAAYVEEERSIEEIVRAGFDRDTVAKVVAMIDASEYKRRQAPPGIKITARAFGRDRRLPITNRYRQSGDVAPRKSARKERP